MMDHDDGVEIDQIIAESNGRFTIDGGYAPSDDGSVMQLPAASDDDSALAVAGGAGSRFTRKKFALVVVSSAALLAMVVGLGAGLGSKSNANKSVTSSALSYEQCVEEAEMASGGRDGGYRAYEVEPEESSDSGSDEEVETVQMEMMPVFHNSADGADVEFLDFSSNAYSNDNDGPVRRRDLRGDSVSMRASGKEKASARLGVDSDRSRVSDFFSHVPCSFSYMYSMCV